MTELNHMKTAYEAVLKAASQFETDYTRVSSEFNTLRETYRNQRFAGVVELRGLSEYRYHSGHDKIKRPIQPDSFTAVWRAMLHLEDAMAVLNYHSSAYADIVKLKERAMEILAPLLERDQAAAKPVTKNKPKRKVQTKRERWRW